MECALRSSPFPLLYRGNELDSELDIRDDAFLSHVRSLSLLALGLNLVLGGLSRSFVLR